MFRFYKNVLIVWVIFILISSIAGGGLFRSLGKKSGGVASKIIDFVAAKADDMKEDTDLIIDNINKLLGRQSGIAHNAPENSDTASDGGKS